MAKLPRSVFRTIEEARHPEQDMPQSTVFTFLKDFWNTFNPAALVQHIQSTVYTGTGIFPGAGGGIAPKGLRKAQGTGRSSLFQSRSGAASSERSVSLFREDPFGPANRPPAMPARRRIVIR